MIELLFAALVGIAMPVRALRRRRRAVPVRFDRYLLETLLLIAVLAWILWRREVPPRAIGLHVESYADFGFDLAVCLLVVVGPDAWAARRIAKTTVRADALPPPDPLFADVLAGRHGVKPFVAAMLVGAVWEELCFRASVLMLVPQTPAGLLLGIGGGSIAFGAQHLRNGLRRAAYACGYGVMFAVLYVLTQNLIAVIVAHAAGNILSGLQWTPRLERARKSTAASLPEIFVG